MTKSVQIKRTGFRGQILQLAARYVGKNINSIRTTCDERKLIGFQFSSFLFKHRYKNTWYLWPPLAVVLVITAAVSVWFSTQFTIDYRSVIALGVMLLGFPLGAFLGRDEYRFFTQLRDLLLGPFMIAALPFLLMVEGIIWFISRLSKTKPIISIVHSLQKPLFIYRRFILLRMWHLGPIALLVAIFFFDKTLFLAICLFVGVAFAISVLVILGFVALMLLSSLWSGLKSIRRQSAMSHTHSKLIGSYRVATKANIPAVRAEKVPVVIWWSTAWQFIKNKVCLPIELID